MKSHRKGYGSLIARCLAGYCIRRTLKAKSSWWFFRLLRLLRIKK